MIQKYSLNYKNLIKSNKTYHFNKNKKLKLNFSRKRVVIENNEAIWPEETFV